MATKEAYFLTFEDRVKLQRLIEATDKILGNVRSRDSNSFDDQEFTAPETFLALTPTAGIPAKAGDVPGAAECLLQVTINPNQSPQIVNQSLLTKRVLNHSNGDIAGDTTILITRDKFGSWYPLLSQTPTPVPTSDKSFFDICFTKDPSTGYVTGGRKTLIDSEGTASCEEIGDCPECPGTGTSGTGPSGTAV